MNHNEKFERAQEKEQKSESKITGELQSGKHDLVTSQKQHVAELKEGKSSGITRDFGKPLIFDDSVSFGKQADAPSEVSQQPDKTDAPTPVLPTTEVNFALYRDSAQGVDNQAQGGTREAPNSKSLDNLHPEKGRIHFFKEPDGHSVAVSTDFKSVMRSTTDSEGNTRVYSEQIESFTGRTDVIHLGDGKTLMVSTKSMGDATERKDQTTPLPSDGCCIYAIDENTGKAYRYPPDGKLIDYGDGTNIQATLEHFKHHWPSPNVELKPFGSAVGDNPTFGGPPGGADTQVPTEKDAESPPKPGNDSVGGPPERTGDGIKEGTKEEQTEALRKAFEERKSGVQLSKEELKAVAELEDAILKGDGKALEGTMQRLARTENFNLSRVMTEMNHDLEICGAAFDTATNQKNNPVWCLMMKGSDSFYTVDPSGKEKAQVTKADMVDPVTNQMIVKPVADTDANSYLNNISEQMRKGYWAMQQFG